MSAVPEKYCGAPSYTDIPACLQIGGEKMKRILAFLLVLTVALGLGANNLVTLVKTLLGAG